MSTESADPLPLKFYDRRLLPADAPTTRSRRLIRCMAWLAVAGLFGFALKNDIALLLWRYRVMPQGPHGLAKEIFYSLRDFGQTLPIVVTCIIVLVLDRRRWTIVPVILVAQVLGMAVYDTAKFTVMRDRPQAAVRRVILAAPEGASGPGKPEQALSEMEIRRTWIGFSWYNRSADTQSFPSGHSAAAFAFAGVLAWFYPPLAAMFWILAGGCAASRYVDVVHWPSDCVAGASIGYASAWVALRPHVWSVPLRIVRRRAEQEPRTASTQ